MSGSQETAAKKNAGEDKKTEDEGKMVGSEDKKNADQDKKADSDGKKKEGEEGCLSSTEENGEEGLPNAAAHLTKSQIDAITFPLRKELNEKTKELSVKTTECLDLEERFKSTNLELKEEKRKTEKQVKQLLKKDEEYKELEKKLEEATMDKLRMTKEHKKEMKESRKALLTRDGKSEEACKLLTKIEVQYVSMKEANDKYQEIKQKHKDEKKEAQVKIREMLMGIRDVSQLRVNSLESSNDRVSKRKSQDDSDSDSAPE